MTRRKRFKPTLFAVLLALIFAAAAVAVFAVAKFNSKLDFSARFYFVCYGSFDGAVSAGSVSDAVESYGGAGYVVEDGGKFYVTYSCYYDEDDAKSVIGALAKKSVNCTLLICSRSDYPLTNFSARRNAKLYEGNLAEFIALSKIAYGCANSLDGGDCTQSAAKSVLASIDQSLCALQDKNGENCFRGEISRIRARCFDAGEGYIYSRDLRALQIALCDSVLNIELY